MVIFVCSLGVLLVLMIAVPLGIWDGMARKSCSDVINEKEYAPYVFDAGQGKTLVLFYVTFITFNN